MKDFSMYINAQDKEQLKRELQELYSSFELVRNYYHMKLEQSGIDENLLSKYKDQVTKAIYPNKYMQGGLDFEKVDSIVKPPYMILSMEKIPFNLKPYLSC